MADMLPAFVTFNYDRSLEHFFRTALANSYRKTPAEVRAVLEKIPIVHVHGALGALDAKDGRTYKPDLHTPDIQTAMGNIAIMPEAKHSSPEFEEARELLGSAKQIVFLGFGYHPPNMKRLEVVAYEGKIAGGSSLGLGDAERREIQELWNVPMFVAENAQHLNSLAFLKDAVRIR